MYVQEVIGFFIYYSQVVYINIITAFNSIAESQASLTEKTLVHLTQLLDYISWHPQASI